MITRKRCFSVQNSAWGALNASQRTLFVVPHLPVHWPRSGFAKARFSIQIATGDARKIAGPFTRVAFLIRKGARVDRPSFGRQLHVASAQQAPPRDDAFAAISTSKLRAAGSHVISLKFNRHRIGNVDPGDFIKPFRVQTISDLGGLSHMACR